MSVTWLEAVGLIGVTLVIAKGSIFNPLRDVLLSFEHDWNPLRWFGNLISCAMCSGWWVGLAWGLLKGWSFLEAAVFGGAVSISAMVCSSVVDFFDIELTRQSKRSNGMFSVSDLVRYRKEQQEKKRQADKLTRPKTRFGEEPERMPTEEEANEFLDDHNRRADTAP